MRSFLVLSAILAVCAAFDEELISVKYDENHQFGDVRETPSIELVNGTFDAPLDHFNPTDNRRLRLTYRANVEFFEDGSPIFFFISDIFSRDHWITNGLVYDLARSLNGALVTSDVRYFGRNRFWNSTTENLRFFTVDHVLADFPYLVRKVKEDLDSPNSRVVVWGSRLSASLAALARKKFPHVVDGVWSSSGIFRAVATETEFYNTLAYNIHLRGPANCSNLLSSTFTQVQELLNDNGTQRVQELFNLCSPVNTTSEQDLAFFYETLFDFVSFYIDFRHNVGIQELCQDLARKNDSLVAFARWVRYVYGDDECFNLNYENTITNLQNVASPRHDARRVLEYFYCTQFGLNFRVTSENGFGDVFPDVISQEYHEQWCQDLFGDAYNRTLFERAVDNFNVQHGAQNQVISSAIFSNGNLDPYLSHGIAEYDINTSEAVNTQYASASADLGSISENDSVELTNTKRAIVAALSRFAAPVFETEEGDGESEPEDKFHEEWLRN